MGDVQVYRDLEESLEDQIDRLARFILSRNREYPKEGGAVDTAIAMITDYTHRVAIKEAEIADLRNELVEIDCNWCQLRHRGGRTCPGDSTTCSMFVDCRQHSRRQTGDRRTKDRRKT